VLEDADAWGDHPDAHKWASITSSFNFVTDGEGMILDLDSVYSLPKVNAALCLDHQWWSQASPEDVLADVGRASDFVKEMASYMVRARPKKKAIPKRKAGARNEMTINEKRQYGKTGP